MPFWMICLIGFSPFIGIFIYSLISVLNEEKKIDKETLKNESNLTTEKNLFEHYKQKEQFKNKLLAVKPKIIFVENDCPEVFLTHKALCYFNGKNRYYETFPLKFDTIQFKLLAKTETRTYHSTKDKSVVGRAVVGGVLAGGVGAVVGAASGLSSGGKKTVETRGTFYTGKYRFGIAPRRSGNRIIKPEYIIINKHLAEKTNFEKRMQKETNVSIRIGGPVHKLVKNELCKVSSEIISWLNNECYEVYRISENIEDEQFAEKMMNYLKERRYF